MNKYSPFLRSWRSNKCLQSCSVVSIPRGKTYSTTAEPSEKSDDIVIPPRIHRSPTDILLALSGTVGRDPTASHFKYHDDPYLIPTSNYKKRVYAMAQESGRKAAHWIRQEHKDFFMYTVSDPPLKLKTPHINAEPQIAAYIPKAVYDDSSEVCEEDLKTCMRNSLVSDAKKVYELLAAKDPDSISQESKQQFLELLCFFNDEDPIAEEWMEERRFRQGKWMGADRHIVLWKGQGAAQSFFDGLETKTPEAYCAIIQGMCKYYQAEKAYALYQECMENNIPLNTNVYNGLLSIVGFLKESPELRWQLVTDLLNEMKSKGLTPNLGTMNSILETVSSMNNVKSKQYCLSVLADFKKLGVEPSLGTWYHVLNTFCKEKGPRSDILYAIMDQLDGKEFKIQDSKDVFFFVTAMGLCRYHVTDVNLAERVHALLFLGSNYDLIGDSYKESIYYRHYFSLQCRCQPLNVFMELYYDLVPHVYIPEPSVMKEVLRNVDANGACEHYALLWSHMVMFGQSTMPILTEFLLDSMVQNLPPVTSEPEVPKTSAVETKELPAESSMNFAEIKTLGSALSLGLGSLQKNYGEENKPVSLEQTFANIAWDIWTQVESQSPEKTNKDGWTGAMLGNVIQILVHAKRLDDAQLAVKKLNTDGGASGIPASPQPLLDFARLAITEKKPTLATPALSYLVECGFPDASEGAIDILGILLNKPRAEIEELASQTETKDTAWQADTNVANLLAIVNQKSLRSDSQRNASQSRESSESSNSDTSDSDSSDDEGVAIKPLNKN